MFVIDTGRVKENRYDDLNKMPTLTECWVSKASAKQRRGRAGRVKPGYCWHLYSTHTHDKELVDYQLPEMLRVGLEDLVLQILVLDLGENLCSIVLPSMADMYTHPFLYYYYPPRRASSILTQGCQPADRAFDQERIESS